MHYRTHLQPQLGFDLLRVYLGIGLTVRGGLVASDPTLLDQFINRSDWLLPMFTAHAVVLSHVVGGMLLALGCCTRWAAAIQIPPVAGALFLVHWREGLFSHTQSTEFAALVLIALTLYAVFGAGDFSFDRHMERVRAGTLASEGDVGQASLSQASVSPAGSVFVPRVTREPAAASPALSDSLASSVPDAGLDLADPPQARARYRDTKLELTLLVLSSCVLFVLLAVGAHIAATAWMMGSVFMFGIWRIGRARFE